MIMKKREYQSLAAMISKIKNHKDVIGIVEYGGRSIHDASMGGDYDVTIIVVDAISTNFSGLHFHVGDLPVDCMLCSLGDFSTDYPSNPFLMAHLGASILYDRDGQIKIAMDNIKDRWGKDIPLRVDQINLYRFTFRHVLDKLEHRLMDNPLFSRIFIQSSFDWFLECYVQMHGLALGKTKEHLAYIERKDPKLFQEIERLYSTLDIHQQFRSLEVIAQRMTQAIGGMWEKGEVLFHLLENGTLIEEECQKALSIVFG